MSEVSIIYWRDIPTQVVMGRGRMAIKRQLAARFMVAVDKAAMNDGATGTQAYLADWRKVVHPASDAPDAPDADDAGLVERLAVELETQFSAARLAEMAANMGRKTADKDID